MAERINFREWQTEAAGKLTMGRDSETALRMLRSAFAAVMPGAKIHPLTPEVAAMAIIADDPDGDPDEVSSTVMIDVDEATGGNTLALHISPKGLMAGSAYDLTQRLDSQIIGFGTQLTSELPRPMEKKRAELWIAPNNVWGLAKLMYQYLGDEATELTFALGLYSEIHEKKALFDELADTDVHLMPVERKKAILDKWFGDAEPIDLEACVHILKCTLGARFTMRFLRVFLGGGGEQNPEAIVAQLKELVETKADFRRKLMLKARELPMVADQMLLSSFVRMGWLTLGNTPVSTLHDFYLKVRSDVEHINADEELRARYHAKPDYRTKVASMEAYFATHGEEDTEEERKIWEVIDVAKHREALNDPRVAAMRPFYALRQHQTVLAIAQEVFQLGLLKEGYSEAVYKAGFPSEVVQKKSPSCFSGPWLIAAILLECGFDYEDMYYCQVSQSIEGMVGGHGGLVLRLKNKELLFIDFGYKRVVPIRPQIFENPKALAEFFDAKNPGRIRTSVPFSAALYFQMHPSMQIMDLTAGFTSGHLLHTGIHLYNNDDPDAAEYALKMALAFLPDDIDALYYLALIEMERHNRDEAIEYAQRCVEIFPNYVAAHFILGQMAETSGDTAEAIKRYQIIAAFQEEDHSSPNPNKWKIKGTVFGDDKFLGTAAERLADLTSTSQED